MSYSYKSLHRSGTDGAEDGSQDEETGLINPSNTTENYGSLSSKLNDVAKRRAADLDEQRETSKSQGVDDAEPLAVRRVRRDDGTDVDVNIGKSTLIQTVFNSSNTVVGVGMLALPLGVRYAGWVFGMGMLIAFAIFTRYTASILGKCMDVDRSVANFADIAYLAFGEKGRVATSILLTFELTGACISLIILFADTMHALIPKLDLLQWKVVCGIILLPLNFVPMRLLGYTSFVGIFCLIGILVLIFIDGFLKGHGPGSLRDPMTTYAWPQTWAQLPLGFGLTMAPYGGHAVFSSIYRDMTQPWKYDKGLQMTFGFAAFMDGATAIIGYLMFGNLLKDELTTNVLTTSGYPNGLNILLLVMVAIVPITKFPLCIAPTISTLEVFTRIDPRAATLKPNRFNQSKFLTRCLKIFFRLITLVVIILLAIAIPSFELISAILGSLFCFSICIVLPVSFHLKMFSRNMSRLNLIWDIALIAISVLMGSTGFVFEFLPRSWLGLE